MKVLLSEHQQKVAMNIAGLLALIIGIRVCARQMRDTSNYWLRPAAIGSVEANKILSKALFNDDAISPVFETALFSGGRDPSVFVKAVLPGNDLELLEEVACKWTRLTPKNKTFLKHEVADVLTVFNLNAGNIRSIWQANNPFLKIIIMEPRGDEVDVYVHADTSVSNGDGNFYVLFTTTP
jgi:hypothetical protein